MAAVLAMAAACEAAAAVAAAVSTTTGDCVRAAGATHIVISCDDGVSPHQPCALPVNPLASNFKELPRVKNGIANGKKTGRCVAKTTLPQSARR